MLSQSTNPRLASFLKRGSQIATAVTASVGVSVLIGWALDIAILKSVLPGLVTMKANTALGFLLAGLSLWFQGRAGRNQQYLACGCAVLVALIGGLTLSQYLFGLDLGIDQLLFQEPTGAVGTSNPGRMAPTTALNFLLIGISLLLLERGRGVRMAQWCTLTAGAIGLLNCLGYLYGVEALYGFASYTKMAVHTAVAFLILALGFLCAHPDQGMVGVITADAVGGKTARRLLPVVIGIPILLGWLCLQGQRAGSYGTQFGLAMVVLGSILIFGLLVGWTGRSLNHADAKRRVTEEERTRFFTLSLDLLCIAGFDGYFKQVNPRWEQVLGFTAEELLASPYLDFVHPDDRHRTLAEAQQLTAEGQVTVSFENRYRCKDGSYKWLLWNAVPSAERQVIYATAHDITERKRMEQLLEAQNTKLEAANKELEAFSYSVSHDLRAPLRAIDGFSRILLEDYAGALDAEGQRLLGVVRDNTQNMAQLIDDLLAFSRIGRVHMAASTIHMQALVQEVLEELKPTLGERAVHFEVTPLPEVRGDLAMIRQVVVNLLTNAVKFTRPRPHADIEVGARVEDGQAIYYVKDNGAGFDMQYTNKLFGVFQRLHRQEEFEGTGVGLAIVQRVVHRHGGRVWAEGKVNEGATFYFSLPTAEGRHG